MTNDSEWYYISNDGWFARDEALPYVVVSVDGELNGRFPNQATAITYLKAINWYGRIIYSG